MTRHIPLATVALAPLMWLGTAVRGDDHPIPAIDDQKILQAMPGAAYTLPRGDTCHIA